MSQLLLEFTKSYINERIDTHTFANGYLELWKIERDSKTPLNDSDRLSEILSSIFCIVDLYNPEQDKEEYELDSKQLCIKVQSELSKLAV